MITYLPKAYTTVVSGLYHYVLTQIARMQNLSREGDLFYDKVLACWLQYSRGKIDEAVKMSDEYNYLQEWELIDTAPFWQEQINTILRESFSESTSKSQDDCFMPSPWGAEDMHDSWDMSDPQELYRRLRNSYTT